MPTITSSRQQRRPWGRIVAGVIGVVILFVAIYFLLHSREMRRVADAALVAEPVHQRVDVSKPGKFTGEFRQTFRGACQGYLEIVPDKLPSTEREAVTLLRGLQGHFSIVGSDGRVVHQNGIAEAAFVAFQMDKDHWTPALGHGDYFSFDKGVYQIRLVVDHGAPALAGVPHSLVARYGLCGLEYLPAQIEWLIGIAGCVIAGVLLLPVAFIIIAERRRHRESEHTEEA